MKALLLPPLLLVALASVNAPAESAGGHLKSAAVAFEAGDWTAAEMSYRRAVAEESDSIEARLGLARAIAAGGDPERASTELGRGAERWLLSASYAEAETLLAAAAVLTPARPELQAELGRVRFLGRRYLSAEEPLAAAYESGAASEATALYYASTLWETGRLDRAEVVLREAVSRSGSFAARYQLGRLLLWAGRHQEAAQILSACAAEVPDGVDVLVALGRALDGAGQAEEAVVVFSRAADLAPSHSELRYGLAMALLDSGDRAGAQRELGTYRELYEAEQLRTRAEGLDQARIARGEELLRRGRAAEAVTHLRELGESADALAALATGLESLGDLEGAVEELSRAVAVAPDRTDLRARLNEARLELLRQP